MFSDCYRQVYDDAWRLHKKYYDCSLEEQGAELADEATRIAYAHKGEPGEAFCVKLLRDVVGEIERCAEKQG